MPLSISCVAIDLASLTGIANPMPMLPHCEPADEPREAIEELMPTSWPLALTSAPPLLPGLMAAEVWIALVTTGSDCAWPGALRRRWW